jgi:hypothetical protein
MTTQREQNRIAAHLEARVPDLVSVPASQAFRRLYRNDQSPLWRRKSEDC